MGRLTGIIGVVLVVALGILASASIFTVHQTPQALVLQFGDPRRVITEPGLNFKVPFVQNVISIDKRILDLDSPAEELELHQECTAVSKLGCKLCLSCTDPGRGCGPEMPELETVS